MLESNSKTARRGVSGAIDVLTCIANATGVPIGDILGRSRKACIAEARHMATKLARETHKMATLEDIGDTIGGRDHTTVIWSLKRHDMLYESYPPYTMMYDEAKHQYDIRAGRFSGNGDDRVSAPRKPEFFIAVNATVG